MRFIRILMGMALAVTCAAPAFAQNGNGNGAPSGEHYSLNIVGVDRGKTADMTGSNRHTIFVALNSRGGVSSKIYLVPGQDFRVCDGNAFDNAWGCEGEDLPRIGDGAVFMLPCNTNLVAEEEEDGDIETLYGCDGDDPQLAYEVWARVLGKPGGDVIITTCATEVQDINGDGVLDTECSTENVVMVRNPGKSTFGNVTQELTSLVACYDTDADPDIEDIDCFRYALFRDELQDWFWNYDNNGIRLAQIRFYPLDQN